MGNKQVGIMSLARSLTAIVTDLQIKHNESGHGGRDCSQGRNETNFREDLAENSTHDPNYDAVTTAGNALRTKANRQVENCADSYG